MIIVENPALMLCCRLEKVALSCLYSKVKIVGTFLCVLGALTMSIMQSTVSPKDVRMATKPTDDLVVFDTDKITGCIYLIAAVIVLSSNVVLQVNNKNIGGFLFFFIFILLRFCVLQAATLGGFPAPMSLCAITSFIGVIITAMFQFVQVYDFENWDWPLVSVTDLIGVSLLVCNSVPCFEQPHYYFPFLLIH